MGRSFIAQRRRAHHQIAGGQPVIDGPSGADPDEQFCAAGGKLLDDDGRDRRAHRQAGQAQARCQPQQRPDAGTMYFLVVSACPHPAFQVALPRENDSPRDLARRVTQ